jgi:anti-sigma B factor antagonist
MILAEHMLGEWKVATLSGRRLDAFVESELRQALAELVADGTKRVVLDLSSVEFMDSSGLGAIVYCRRLLGSDGQVVLAGAQPGVLTTLRLTRLDKVFPLVESPERVAETVT